MENRLEKKESRLFAVSNQDAPRLHRISVSKQGGQGLAGVFGTMESCPTVLRRSPQNSL